MSESGHHKAFGCVVAQPSTSPSPMAFHRINNQRDEKAIDYIHRELCALGHGTADNSGGSGTKDCFKHQETLYRQITLIKRKVAPVGSTDETSAIGAKHKAKTYEKEQYRTKHEIDKVLKQNIGSVLTAGETCFTQRKTGLHPKYEYGS